jgi:NAD(P)-dependent dehydrogenase (short-subunit alcohol dehydrogenase family)
MTPLAGQSVLITGAAHGIGAEVARRLAARGARVSLVGLGADELRRVAADCPGAVVFDADVTDQEALDAAVAGTVEAFGGIDTVMANAGIASPGFVRTMDPAAFERVIEVNLLGVWRTVRACLPHVIERRGYVLPVASMAAIVPGPGLAAYATAKTGVEAFGNALRVEVQGYGVKVGVAYFSWIDTEMVRGADRTELGASMRGMLKGPLAKTYPVSDAAEAVVRGIEQRRRIVACPRWLPLLMAVRPLLPWLTELTLKRDIAEFDRLAEREAAERGSDPVGAGGEAEMAERAARTSTAH